MRLEIESDEPLTEADLKSIKKKLVAMVIGFVLAVVIVVNLLVSGIFWLTSK